MSYPPYRRVHTNSLKCELHQTIFEPIHICSIHTLVTESEFDYGLQKLHCVGTRLHEDLS